MVARVWLGFFFKCFCVCVFVIGCCLFVFSRVILNCIFVYFGDGGVGGVCYRVCRAVCCRFCVMLLLWCVIV